MTGDALSCTTAQCPLNASAHLCYIRAEGKGEVQMCSQREVFSIIHQLCERLQPLFPQERFDVILFGSYARNDADDASDIDVLLLADASRQRIAEKIGKSVRSALTSCWNTVLSFRPS